MKDYCFNDKISPFVPEYEVCHIKEIKNQMKETRYLIDKESPRVMRSVNLVEVEAPLSSRGTKKQREK